MTRRAGAAEFTQWADSVLAGTGWTRGQRARGCRAGRADLATAALADGFAAAARGLADADECVDGAAMSAALFDLALRVAARDHGGPVPRLLHNPAPARDVKVAVAARRTGPVVHVQAVGPDGRTESGSGAQTGWRR